MASLALLVSLAVLTVSVTGSSNATPLDDDKWMSTVSQFDKREYWNKFRDEVEDDSFRSWSPSNDPHTESDSVKPAAKTEASSSSQHNIRTEDVVPETADGTDGSLSHAEGTDRNQGLDSTKDPCMKVRCPLHKICVSHDSQTAICTNHRPAHHSVMPRKEVVPHKRWTAAVHHGKCRPCPLTGSSSVCGSDGHTYTSPCKLEFQACSSGKSISVRCEGPCPCLPGQEVLKPHKDKKGCSDVDLRSLAFRLKDWFGVLHLDANRDLKISASDAAPGRFDTSILPICKDSLGWMFNKLDMNYDLLLDQSELSALYLDKYELCMRPLFNSCDSFKDGKLSNNEWCFCFQKPEGMPCQNEMNRIHSQARRKSLIGAYVPRCARDGYFKATQCHGSTGQCWCVDKYGNEIAGSRRQGNPTCEEDEQISGDFGSGVVLLDDQDDESPQRGRGRQKERRSRLHPRGAIEDDDDGEDDETGYLW